MLIIQKYGGTSLADGGKIQRAAGRIANLAMQGCQMVVVVSAQGDTTDEMIARAAQVNKRGSSREMDAYLLSFDAHNILVSIHPWVDGNGRMSRLIMNHLQFEFNLVPTKVMTDDKAAYIEALNASREEESMLPFQSFMLQEHIKNLKAEIEQYERSMDDDVVINVGKNLKNVGKEKLIELSERQQNIISVVKHHPEITIPELAQRMSGKKTVTTRTIERDIAALQAMGILKREGSRKSGKWIVVNI